jgi:hypothetical protein
MTSHDFNDLQARLGVSRAELCRRIGIAYNSGIAYSTGKADIPKPIALACAAVAAGIPPYAEPGSTDQLNLQ